MSRTGQQAATVPRGDLAAGRSAMSATATARRAVPICRTHRRNRSPSGLPCAPCGVPLCRTGSDTVRPWRVPVPRSVRPFRSRPRPSVPKYKLPSRVCAQVRTRAHAGFLTHSFILSYIPPPTGAKFAPHECKVCTRPTADRCKVCTRHNLPCVPRPACRAVPCAGQVRARPDLPPRPCALCRAPRGVPDLPRRLWRSRRTTAGR